MKEYEKKDQKLIAVWAADCAEHVLRHYSRGIFVIWCTISFMLALAVIIHLGFFINLASTLSPYSYGDIIYHVQSWFNLINNRPLQTSLFSQVGYGVLSNAANYASQVAVHVNFTPYIFAPLFALCQDIYGLYGMFLLVNYASLALFGYAMLRVEGSPQPLTGALLTLALTVCSSLTTVFLYKCHFLLLVTPFVLGAYYFQRVDRPKLFLLAVVAASFVGEDSALFLGTMCLYLFFYGSLRKSIYAVGAVSAAFIFLLDVIVLQPAARFSLATTSAAHTLYMLKAGSIPSINALLRANYVLMVPVLLLTCLVLLLDLPKTRRHQLLALIFLAPLSHWVISLMSGGGGHHALPSTICLYIAFIQIIAIKGPFRFARFPRYSPWITGAMVTVLLAVSLYANRQSVFIWHNWSGYPEPVAVEESNLDVIAAASRILKAKTLVYLTNDTAEGFLSNRSDIWRFPGNWRDADVLLIQKDVLSTFCIPANKPIKWVDSDIDNLLSIEERCKLPSWFVEDLKVRMTSSSHAYKILEETGHVLVLERPVSVKIDMPRDSMGMAFLANTGPALRRLFHVR